MSKRILTRTACCRPRPAEASSYGIPYSQTNASHAVLGLTLAKQ